MQTEAEREAEEAELFTGENAFAVAFLQDALKPTQERFHPTQTVAYAIQETEEDVVYYNGLAALFKHKNWNPAWSETLDRIEDTRLPVEMRRALSQQHEQFVAPVRQQFDHPLEDSDMSEDEDEWRKQGDFKHAQRMKNMRALSKQKKTRVDELKALVAYAQSDEPNNLDQRALVAESKRLGVWPPAWPSYDRQWDSVNYSHAAKAVRHLYKWLVNYRDDYVKVHRVMDLTSEYLLSRSLLSMLKLIKPIPQARGAMGTPTFNLNGKYTAMEVKEAIAMAFPKDTAASDFVYRLLAYAYGTDQYVDWGTAIMQRRPDMPAPNAYTFEPVAWRRFPA